MVTIDITIIDQIAKFLKNLFDFEFDLKNSGKTKIKTDKEIIISNALFK